MRILRLRAVSRLILALGLLLVPAAAGAAGVSFLYDLSDFSGTVPYSDVILRADRAHDEVYAVVGNHVQIFNAAGMKDFEFDVDPALGSVYDIAVDSTGGVLLLTLEPIPSGNGPGWWITRCNYRGEVVGRISITGLPPSFSILRPNALFVRNDRWILANKTQLLAVITDDRGAFLKGFDLAALIGMKEKDRSANELGGLSLDSRGNLLFTIPTLAQAYILSPEGQVREFGKAGSSPGSFGVAAGIAADSRGNIYVADKIRNVVMIFDEHLQFLTEFGAGERRDLMLVRPTELVVGGSDRLYVTQARDQGVAVFRMDPVEPEAPNAPAAPQGSAGETGPGPKPSGGPPASGPPPLGSVP